MSPTHPQVDQYFLDGCGRCNKYQTPACKVHKWTEAMQQLRRILLECGLQEELKWKQPCYTLDSKNVLILAAFVDYCALLFFKGALMRDANHLLVRPGENTQAGRQIRFTRVADVLKSELVLKQYVREAMDLERSGSRVAKKPAAQQPIPLEFKRKMEDLPELRAAFQALTPGRQRAYLMYFSAARQSATREARVEKYLHRILEGKGMNDE